MRKWPLTPTEAYRLFSEYHQLDNKLVIAAAKNGYFMTCCHELESLWAQSYGDLSAYDAGLLYHWVMLYEYVTKSRQFVQTTVKCIEGARAPTPKRIVDFGAGVGFTTAMLALVYPEATLVYANISTKQQAMAQWVFNKVGVTGQVEIVGDGSLNFEPCDLVCVWDVLEHIQAPFAVLDPLLARAQIMSTTPHSFTHADYYGHWREFRIGDAMVSHSAMNKLLHQHMAGLGWRREYQSRFWNDPSVYMRLSR